LITITRLVRISYCVIARLDDFIIVIIPQTENYEKLKYNIFIKIKKALYPKIDDFFTYWINALSLFYHIQGIFPYLERSDEQYIHIEYELTTLTPPCSLLTKIASAICSIIS